MSALRDLAAQQSARSRHRLWRHRLAQSVTSLPARVPKFPSRWNHGSVGEGTEVSFILLWLGSSPSLPLALSQVNSSCKGVGSKVLLSLPTKQVAADHRRINDLLSSRLRMLSRRDWFVLHREKYEGLVCSDRGKSGHDEVLYWLISRWVSCASLAELRNETLQSAKQKLE